MDSLFLYTRPGCHLCDEARNALQGVLAERSQAGLSAPAVVERDIETSDDWHRRFFETIPVVELGERRIELALSPAKIRRLLSDVLDAPAAAAHGT